MEDILGWEPSAPTNDDSVIAYKFKLETYRTSNERTWLRHLLPLIIKDSYRIQVPGDKDSSSAKTYTTRQWHECGLIATTESDFRRTMIPDKFAQLQIDEILAKALRKDEGMTNPRPDECHGLSPDVLALPTDPVWTPETMALLEASPLMHHPFFVVEGKGPAGNSIDSENQAEWDCATLIYNARFLRSDMGEADVNGADLRTMVFSMTFGIDVCKIWVHWAEVTPFGVSIHMTKVRSMNLDDNDVLERARGCANSILHWGLIDRLPDLKEFHKKLCAYEPKHWKAKQAQHDHNKKKRGSPSKQQ